MGKIADIREGLATSMATITSLDTEAYIRDIADVPVAMVGGPDPLEFDQTFGRGSDEYDFPVIVFASRVDDEGGQSQLDSYLDPFGALSLKAAIESDSTLGGVVEDLRVQRVQDYGPHEINGVQYLGAVLIVHVMASGKA